LLLSACDKSSKHATPQLSFCGYLEKQPRQATSKNLENNYSTCQMSLIYPYAFLQHGESR
jgi:hypothetical protein